MEQNKVENQFREKLNKREFKPSENAWDRLDAMLTVAEKPKRTYGWMYFAASFLGFILVATAFLSQTEEAIDVQHQPVVIEQNAVQSEEILLENNVKIQSETPAEVVATPAVAVTNEKLGPKKAIKNPQEIATKLARETKVVVVENNSKATLVDQKPEVKVNPNALLAAVEQNQTTPKIAQNTTSIKVNTNDLLSKVDTELELSFRERVLKSVNKKYQEVKVAVTNRNLE